MKWVEHHAGLRWQLVIVFQDRIIILFALRESNHVDSMTSEKITGNNITHNLQTISILHPQCLHSPVCFKFAFLPLLFAYLFWYFARFLFITVSCQLCTFNTLNKHQPCRRKEVWCCSDQEVWVRASTFFWLRKENNNWWMTLKFRYFLYSSPLFCFLHQISIILLLLPMHPLSSLSLGNGSDGCQRGRIHLHWSN